jgi:hypothetical protein
VEPLRGLQLSVQVLENGFNRPVGADLFQSTLWPQTFGWGGGEVG